MVGTIFCIVCAALKAKKLGGVRSFCMKNHYPKKANSYSIIYTNLHGCGGGQVQQTIYALQTALRINIKMLYVSQTWVLYKW
jgi:hypothetical protein